MSLSPPAATSQGKRSFDGERARTKRRRVDKENMIDLTLPSESADQPVFQSARLLKSTERRARKPKVVSGENVSGATESWGHQVLLYENRVRALVTELATKFPTIHSAAAFKITNPPSEPLKINRGQLQTKYNVAYRIVTKDWTMDGASSRAKNLFFPTVDRSPCVPVLPGQPGFLFGRTTEVLEGVWALFVPSNTRICYNYMGEYQVTRVGNLSARQFAGLPKTVR